MLLKSEVQSGGWANLAVCQLSTAAASSSNLFNDNGKRAKCTELVCVAPHDKLECFERPENAEKKVLWIAKQEAGRAARLKHSNLDVSGVRGVETVKEPMANSALMMSFYTLYGLVELSDTSVEASVAISASQPLSTWALLDTGASHVMFNDETLFVASSISANDNPSQRLKIAGGDVSLAVKSTGTVQLRAGDGTFFALHNCLLVPELAKNLVSGGALFRSHAVPVVHEGQSKNFSVIKNDPAVFNGVFVGNLMLVSLDAVSTFSRMNGLVTSANYSLVGSLQHE